MTWLTWIIVAMIAVVFIVAYLYMGEGAARPNVEHIKGMTSIDHWPKFVNLCQRIWPKADGIKIHPDVRVPKKRETENFILCGTIGSGKTVVVNSWLKQLIADMKSDNQARKRNDKIILYDIKGDYTKALMPLREQGFDVRLLAPWDTRSERWGLWKDIRRVTDAELVASAMIPADPGDKNPIFRNMAVGVIQKLIMCMMGDTDKKGVTWGALNTILSDTNAIRAALKDYAEGRKGLAYIEGDNTQTQGVISTIHSKTPWLGNVARVWGGDQKASFSVRDWLDNGRPGILIVRNHGEFENTAEPLIVMIYNLIMQQHLSRGEDSKLGKIWYVIDEFPTLPAMSKLIKTIPVLRSLGGAFVLTYQDIAQLEQTYGEHGAQIVYSQASTRIVFKSDGKTAKTMESYFGQKEEAVHKTSKSKSSSHGASPQSISSSSSTSYSTDYRTVPVVLDGEIMSLPRADQAGPVSVT